MGKVGAAAAIVGLAVLASSCGSDGPATDGPLGALSDGGGVSIYRPEEGPARWVGSFSGFRLCLDEEGPAARVTDVRVVESVGQVRSVTARIGAAKKPDGTLMFLSAEGAPPAFDQPYAKQNARYANWYEFEDDLSSVPIDRQCKDELRADDPVLVITFETGRAGGTLFAMEVLYEVDGEEFTTGPVPWEMTLCGRSEAVEYVCSGAPEGDSAGR
ncbi:hypothetical protein [Nocardioides sp. J54]|uniref:hypothetical protein n=1 Tax=Nocardioides sp. J54 TaxID=935866 RepID=UPI000490C153|nr:hypothetical protein [Nocardioides sp. J54]